MVSVRTRIKFTRAVLGEIGAFLIALCIITSILFLVMIPFLIGEFTENDSLIISEGFETILIFIFTEISLLSVYFWRLRDFRERIKKWEMKGIKYHLQKCLLIGTGAGILIALFSFLHGYVIVQILELQTEIPPLAYSGFPYINRVIIFLLGTTLVPLSEELFFRRLMFGNILRRGFPKTAYIISCLIFALVHLDFPNFLVYLVCGFVLAFIYQKTRSIVTPFAAHIVLNIIAMSYLLG